MDMGTFWYYTSAGATQEMHDHLVSCHHDMGEIMFRAASIKHHSNNRLYHCVSQGYSGAGLFGKGLKFNSCQFIKLSYFIEPITTQCCILTH